MISREKIINGGGKRELCKILPLAKYKRERTIPPLPRPVYQVDLEVLSGPGIWANQACSQNGYGIISTNHLNCTIYIDLRGLGSWTQTLETLKLGQSQRRWLAIILGDLILVLGSKSQAPPFAARRAAPHCTMKCLANKEFQ